MKRFIGIAAISIIIALAGQSTIAQNLKFGHINSDELIQALPQFIVANDSLESFRQELINALELLSVELNNKSDAYQKEMKNLSAIVRQNKEQELVDMNRRIQEFQTNAQEQLQNKQSELFQPIMAKVDKAIKDVGKENGFTYIFDVAKGSLLYFDTTKSTDVMALAKAKLGIK
jgi:outer membrane protein